MQRKQLSLDSLRMNINTSYNMPADVVMWALHLATWLTEKSTDLQNFLPPPFYSSSCERNVILLLSLPHSWCHLDRFFGTRGTPICVPSPKQSRSFRVYFLSQLFLPRLLNFQRWGSSSTLKAKSNCGLCRQYRVFSLYSRDVMDRFKAKWSY